MLNRRKALIGWLVWTAAKPLARRAIRSKAKGAVPGRGEGSRGPNKAALVAGAAALVAALMFWRRRGGDDAGEPSG